MGEETYKDKPPLIDVAQPAEQFDLLEPLFKTPSDTTPVTRWVNATKECVLRRVSCRSEKEVVSGHLATFSLELSNEIRGAEFQEHLS